MSAKIKDFVGVSAHPTVVRFEHLDADDSEWLVESYYETPEVGNHFTSLRRTFANPTGCGVFVVGQYGCGKSHFLAVLIAALREGRFVPTGWVCWLLFSE